MEILTGKARLDKHLTLKELSRRTDLSISTLNNIENEKTSPTMWQMEQIAKALNMKISDLYKSKYK